MRISDWSSDVCSSDLQPALGVQRRGAGEEVMLNRTSKPDVDRARREESMRELIDVETREVSMSVVADRVDYDGAIMNIFAQTSLMPDHQMESHASGEYVVRDLVEAPLILGEAQGGPIHV